MTLEQKHAAQDILASLISFDCSGIDCYNCPFSYSSGSCMVTTAHRKFEEINLTKDQISKATKDQLNSLYGTTNSEYHVYADTDSIKSTEKGDN